MFDQTSRTVYENGLRFYEEDILYDSHLYHTNQKVYLEVDCLKDGVGLLIGLIPNQPIEKQSLYYLIRLGRYSASLFLVNQMQYERLEHVSTPFAAPLEGLKIAVDILPNQITLNLNGTNYMYAYLDYAIGDHHLGLYSQKGNTFKKMRIESAIPDIWRINMDSAENGRVTFEASEMRLSHCKYPSELIQENIVLPAGHYYLTYEGEGITPYVFPTTSAFMSIQHKNLLDSNYAFTLESEQEITLLFVGKEGYVKNIRLSHKQNAPYLETYAAAQKRDEGYLYARLQAIKALEIDFYLEEACDGILFQDDLNSRSETLEKGAYTARFENNRCVLYCNNTIYKTYTYIGDNLTLFRYFDVVITRILITDFNNNTNDWLDRSDQIDWLKPSLSSPILATGKNNEALDLSASFRKVSDKYIFTNVERESFTPYPIAQLEKPIAQLIGVYGIPVNAPTQEQFFYSGLPENMHDISMYCHLFEPIADCTYDKDLNQVLFSESLARYKEIVIDYKKRDSYCINFVSELGMYKVETTSDHYHYYYSKNGQEPYTKTLYTQTEDYYVVLEKGGDDY